MNDIATLLKTFADAHGMSGYEDDVAALLLHEMEPLMDEVRIDTMGNAVGIRAGAGPSVMIAAHMDEIGAMISHIEDSGFLRFVPVGGWYDATILGQRVLIRTKEGKILPGVVGSRPPHVMDAEERKKTVKIKDMFIDCGATSAQNAGELGVRLVHRYHRSRTLPMGTICYRQGSRQRAGQSDDGVGARLLKRKKVKATIRPWGAGEWPQRRTHKRLRLTLTAIATDANHTGRQSGRPKRVAVAAGASQHHHHRRRGTGVMSPPSVIRWLGDRDRPRSPISCRWGMAATPTPRLPASPRGIPWAW